MPLIGSRRAEALSGRMPRPRRWHIRLAILISLLVHVVIVVLLLVTLPKEEREETLPPAAPVTMVFEGGRKTGPTLPQPDLQALPASPPAPEAPAAAEEMPTPPAPPPPPAPPVQTMPVVPVPPAPAPPVVEPKTDAVPAPEPPTDEPVPQPPPPPQKLPPVAKPPAVKPPPKQPPAPKPPDFPAPMDFSFGKAPASPKAPSQSASRPRMPGQIDMSLGPAARGSADPTPFGDDADAAGADWRNALSQWVSEHAYYPPEARRDFEEGDSRIHIVMMPDGRVKEVELVGKSGSVWLDMALQALFRNQRIPALPSGQTQPFEFDFTMHYVLIRRR